MKSIRLSLYTGAVALLAFALGGHASATPIGPNCGSCDGAIYDLSTDGVATPFGDGLHHTYQFKLSIDTNT